MSHRIEHAIAASSTDISRVASACGVTVQAVYAWMRGDVKNLRNDNLFALADITGFEARWIATGQGREKPGGDERKKRLEQLYDSLDERGRAAVFRVAESESSYSTGPTTKVAGGN